MPKSKHDQIAEASAKKCKAEYKMRKGTDIVRDDRVIEVETTNKGYILRV